MPPVATSRLNLGSDLPTSDNTRKLLGVECCRGIAATVVVLYHVARHLNKVDAFPGLMSIFQFGHAGVDLFFVISGFIILFVHYEDIGSVYIYHYVGRRVSRIMPTYWVALGLTVLMSLASDHNPVSFPDLVWSATLLPSHVDPLLGVAWTLQFEIVFYMTFCAFIINKILGGAIFSLWLTWIFVAKFFNGTDMGLPPSLFGFYNLEFFLGMGVAYWLKTRSVLFPKLVLMLGAVLFFMIAITEDLKLINGYLDWSRLAYGPAAALIVLGTAEVSRKGLITFPEILQRLGAASYSIYLFQFIFIGVAWKVWLMTGLDRELPLAISFPVLAIAAITGGVFMSRLVEHPLMRLFRRSRAPAPSIAIS